MDIKKIYNDAYKNSIENLKKEVKRLEENKPSLGNLFISITWKEVLKATLIIGIFILIRNMIFNY